MSFSTLFRFSALTSLAFSTQAFAYDFGGMSGGGGGIIKDLNNPWFLENTKTVSYCINIDAAHFRPDISYVRAMVTRAFDYWTSNFSDAIVPQISQEIPPVRVATQTFTEVSCSQTPDIQFQMGTLDSRQREAFDDPTLYAGAAIRESYDPITMKGRGFIYISPDSGPMRFVGVPLSIPDFWQLGAGGLLYRTIVHELGHIFGLAHMGDSDDIMSDRFIESMMSDDRYRTFFATSLDLPDFFKFRGSPGSGTGGGWYESFSSDTREFFGMPANSQAFAMSVKDANTILVKTGSGREPLKPLGEITLLEQGPITWVGGVTVYLPEGQKALAFPPELKIKTIFGPQRIFQTRKGLYRSLDGRVTRQVIVPLHPSGPSYFIGGVINGILKPNVVYN